MEFLKEHLGEELYLQVSEKLKGSSLKLADLSTGEFVSKMKFDDLLTERDTIKNQLLAANEQIESYKGMNIDEVSKAAEEWKAKYETETAALNQQLQKKDFEFAASRLLSEVKFSSKSAEKAFISGLTEKTLPIQDGKLLGFDDYLEEYKKNDPGAFAATQAAPPVGGAANPGTQPKAQENTGAKYAQARLEQQKKSQEHLNNLTGGN